MNTLDQASIEDFGLIGATQEDFLKKLRKIAVLGHIYGGNSFSEVGVYVQVSEPAEGEVLPQVAVEYLQAVKNVVYLPENAPLLTRNDTGEELFRANQAAYLALVDDVQVELALALSHLQDSTGRLPKRLWVWLVTREDKVLIGLSDSYAEGTSTEEVRSWRDRIEATGEEKIAALTEDVSLLTRESA